MHIAGKKKDVGTKRPGFSPEKRILTGYLRTVYNTGKIHHITSRSFFNSILNSRSLLSFLCLAFPAASIHGAPPRHSNLARSSTRQMIPDRIRSSSPHRSLCRSSCAASVHDILSSSIPTLRGGDPLEPETQDTSSSRCPGNWSPRGAARRGETRCTRPM